MATSSQQMTTRGAEMQFVEVLGVLWYGTYYSIWYVGVLLGNIEVI